MSEVKVTKSEKFAAVADVLKTAGEEDLADFIEGEIALIAAHAAKSKISMAAKRAEADEYTKLAASALTDEFQTATELAKTLCDEDFTISKLRARLTKLIKAGDAEKGTAEEDGKNHVAYKLAEVDAA